MHHLAATSHATGMGHPTQQVVAVEAAADECHDSGDDCPNERHGHPGQVCQVGSPNTGSPVVAAAGVGLLDPVTPYRRPVSPMTAAADAPGGSGCGPPSLTKLSISRT